MRHIKEYKLFESSSQLTPDQIKWLDSCASGRWTLNPTTGLVDVVVDFDCDGQNLTDFKGVKFGVIEVGFDCSYNNLTSLEGAPQHVGGYFFCYNNNLTSLKGAPQDVGGSFECSNNNLTSLEGAPQHVGKRFDCSNNNLTSLEGAPQDVGGRLYSYDNPVSELVLNKIFGLMRRMSYQKAVEKLWNEIPVDDQALLFRSDFDWIDPTERRKLEALASVNKIKGMI
jgi:hypothetical protein